ncbi:terminase small subunit [Stenotrophomonas phage Paxi]|uniref:Terminase small subunit n=1 Tax=Stenotrophomonas phage Paxi TaxID=2859653 RepID=A0AAE8BHT0_9CAUD|nr:terminase small subunit [Stenotrophomonas phage Paxi]QYW01855.1 terminase small subunit [Stenotrophomonas phage Paxi]
MSNDLLTVEQVAQALPRNLRSMATQEFADKINNIVADPEIAEVVRDNFISYTKVLQEGKFKTEDYLNAVTYVTYKMMGYSNGESYAKTFPARHADQVARGLDARTISAYVAMYHKGKLVQAILEQSLIPFWLLNQDARQKALNRQLWLMENSASEMVQTTAANSVLAHTEKPKDVAPLVNINVTDTGLDALRQGMRDLANAQLSRVAQGVPVKEIAEMSMGRVIEHDDQQ